MATIASTITLHDNMTAVLNRQSNAASTLLNRFQAVNATTENFDLPSQWAVANGSLSEMAACLGQLVSLMQENNGWLQQNNSQLANMGDNFGRVRTEAEQTVSSASGLVSVLKSAAAAVGGLAAIKEIIDLSDTFTSTTARLDMMNDGLQSTEELSEKIFQSAQRSRGEYQSTADAVSKLGLMAGDAFSSSDEIIGFVEQLNKQFTIAGTESSGVQSAMLQLTQAMGSGVLRGEEFNSILEQAPNIIQSIADYMGVPKGELKDMASEGQITAEIVKNAMFAAADETNSKFNAMPKTMAQVWTSFKNKAITALQPVLDKISEIANSEAFQSFLDDILAGFNALCEVVEWISGIVQIAITYWDTFKIVLIGAAAAAAVYTVTTHGLEIAMTLLTFAQKAAAVGQKVLNAAMTASPVFWLVTAITAACAALSAYTTYVNKAYGLSLSFGGMLGGVLMTVLAALGNAVIAVGKVFLGVWESMKAIGENIVTFFYNMGVTIAGKIAEVLSGALNFVAQVCEALNKLPFIEFDYSGITDKANKYAATAAVAADAKLDYTDVGSAWDKGWNSIDFIDLDDAFEAGYYLGDKYLGGEDTDPYAVDTSAIDGTTTPTGTEDDPIHTNVDNDVNIADEDLQLMRDVAEARYVQNFVTLTPTVQVSGNTINEKVDVEYVVSEIENRLTNEIVSSAEGVYA